MMKKIFNMLGALLIICILAGCGEDGTISDEMLNDLKDQIEKDITPTPRQEQNITPTPRQEQQSTVTPEPTAAVDLLEPVLCDRLDAWDEFYQNYGKYYTAVQIEDMFFYPGMMGSELGEVVANSKDTQIEMVAMSKLIEPDEGELNTDTQQIVIYRGETPWFTIYVRNYTNDLAALEDCIISLIVPSSEAMAYSRFFDGKHTVESLKQISYQDYAQFEESLANTGYTLSKDGSIWKVASPYEYCPASLSEQVLYWTLQELDVELTINMDTGKVDKIEIDDGYRSGIESSYCALYRREITEDFSWTEGDYIEQLKNIIVEGSNFTDCVEIEMVSLLKKDNKSDIRAIFRMREQDEAGVLVYKLYGVSDLGVNYIGNLTPMSDTPKFKVSESYVGNSYADLLNNSKCTAADIIYELIDGLVREYKEIDSFTGVTAEELDLFVELLEGMIKKNYDYLGEDIDDIVTVTPVYISLGNAETEGGELDQNALWPVFRVDVKEHLAYGIAPVDGETLYMSYDLYNGRIDIEQNIVVERRLEIDGPNKKADFNRLMEACQLLGTPEENPWVTELLPAELAMELEQKYGYELSELSIAVEE